MVKRIVESIKEINKMLGDFLKKPVSDHYRKRDEEWCININKHDKRSDWYRIEYHGYILGDVTVDSCDLSIALAAFKNKLERKITVNMGLEMEEKT